MERLSNILLEGAAYLGGLGYSVGVFTAAGAIVGKPFGPAGGALFGLTVTVLNKPILWAARGLLKPQGPGENAGVNFLAMIVSSVASIALTYFTFNAAKISLKSSKVILLNLTALAIGVAAIVTGAAMAAVAIGIIQLVNPEWNRKMWNGMIGNNLGHRTYG